MAVFLVDLENLVCTNTVSQAMRGISIMNEKDTMYFFYSESCQKLKTRYINQLQRQDSEIKIVKLVNSGKNALDFYIVTEVGRLVEQGEKEIAVLSRDNGYRAVKDYLASVVDTKDVMFSVADSICNGFSTFKSEDSMNRYNAFMSEEEPISLNTLKKRLKKAVHNNTLEEKIVEALKDTEFSPMTTEICEFATGKYESRVALYKAAIHQFGRKNGTNISRILSDLVLEK